MGFEVAIYQEKVCSLGSLLELMAWSNFNRARVVYSGIIIESSEKLFRFTVITLLLP